MNQPYRSIDDLPRRLPVFPLSGCLLLPRGDLPLNIFEPRYLAMIDAALGGKRLIGMIQPRSDISGPQPDLFPIGCAGKLTRFAETGDGRYLISLEGVCRFRIDLEAQSDTPFRMFDVRYDEFSGDLAPSGDLDRAEREAVLDALRRFAERHALEIGWQAVSEASDETLVNALSMLSPFGASEKQALLEASDLSERARALVVIAEMDLASNGPARSPLH